MAIDKSRPMRFTPRGVADAWDSTDVFPGACQQLTNLVFDNSNPEIVVPRPGVVTLAQLGALGFANPSFISVQATIGSRIYGMVATTRNFGQDEPFCIDTATNSLVPISGVTSGNTPASPATSGDWTPPTMAAVGIYLIITHPGFATPGFFGVINLTNPAAPTWTSQTTTGNALTGTAIAVSNFNNRAYFAIANNGQVQFTDVLSLNRTSAAQGLTLGDTSSVIAFGGLPIQTTSSGVVAALIAFKASQVWQITGDSALNTLAQNYLSLSVGCPFVRCIAQSILGIYFPSSSGPYVIDPLGTLRLLTNKIAEGEPDIQQPFVNAVTPSRWAGAYTSSIYRVCGPTVIRGQQVTNDYWFDEHKRRWNGPHSFVYDCASAMGASFVLSSAFNPGALISSQPVAQLNSVYLDLTSVYNVTLLSATLPKVDGSIAMAMKQVVESQIELGGLPLGAVYTITAQDEQGNVLNSVTVTVSLGKIWGTNYWGDGSSWQGVPRWGAGGLWGSMPVGSGWIWMSGQNRPPKTYRVEWTAPINFDKMQIQVQAQASGNIQIGTFFARYQETGYMVMTL